MEHHDHLVDLRRGKKFKESNDAVVSLNVIAFKSETGITPNMVPWILEEGVKEAVETPHPT
eukprot:1574868-Amphidinium_carterae.1